MASTSAIFARIGSCRLVLLLPWLAWVCGCASESQNQFQGRITGASADLATKEAHPLGGGFRSAGVHGFSLGANRGVLVFVQRQDIPANGSRLASDDISAVYYIEWDYGRTDPKTWARFIDAAPSQRDQMPGAHRLHGTCKIKKWKLDGDFQIELAMAGDGPSPIGVNGLLISHTRASSEVGWLNPFSYVAGAMMATGVAPLDVKHPPPPPTSTKPATDPATRPQPPSLPSPK